MPRLEKRVPVPEGEEGLCRFRANNCAMKTRGSSEETALLRALYEEYRRRYFAQAGGGYAVPPVEEVTIEWTRRASASAGLCYPGKKLIRLSWQYHSRFPEEIGPTLLHEMIHLIVPGHGKEFHRWLERVRRLGGEVHRYARERPLPKKVRWVYTCRCCRREVAYARRLPRKGRGYFCRRCGPVLGVLQERRVE